MKSKYLTKAFTLILLLWAAGTNANNIQVTINSYDAALKRLNVTLSWDNSWHDGTGTFRDAAWVFIKYKDATMMTWETAPLAVPNPATWQATGNNVRFEALGKNPISTSAAADYRGLIIRRAKTAGLAISDPTMTGVYNVSMTFNIPLALIGIPANPEFKIFALEMVDIPQGSFWAGDGSQYSGIKASATSNAPVNVVNESQITTGACENYSTTGTVTLPAAYPKGFSEFYVMKYELSQEGFVEFLNTLTRAEQNSVFSTTGFSLATSGVWYASHPSAGFTVQISRDDYTVHTRSFVGNTRNNVMASITSGSAPALFGCDNNNNLVYNETGDGQNIPIVTNDAKATLFYLDWAGLSPMSELQFEKACRGTAYPVQHEFSWGASTKTSFPLPNVGLDGSGEAFTANYDGPLAKDFPSGLVLYQPEDLSLGSQTFRCGAFAKPTGSNRLNSGGSYYGVMDLSNNAFELVVPVASPAFIKEMGDGTLSTTPTWPAIVCNKSAKIIPATPALTFVQLSGKTNAIGRVSYDGALINLFTNSTANAGFLGVRGIVYQ